MDSLVEGNHTAVTEFILLGLTQDPDLRVVLFIIILGIYLVTVSGNLCTILLIRVSTQLHHRMYFFLSHLGFSDMILSCSVMPNILVNFLVERNLVSYLGCAIQLLRVIFFGTVKCFLLAAMAYDRFVAICDPLLYSSKMSSQVCLQLLAVTYIGSFLNTSSFTFSFFYFFFFGPNQVNHFFCDYAPLVKLSCTDVSVPAAVPSFTAGSVLVFTVTVIAISYISFLITILKMRSTVGRQKASTCTSHLTAVTLFYGTTTFVYVLPKSMYSTDQNKVISVFYMVIISCCPLHLQSQE
ncbi:olfactory receptor 502-like [Perognathus longimembris pacificus]|uniref:olfactory receptor 502-like n=1 Tax=Perognathus longimembris pacificus TaxID=214514 RepID=UPI002018DD33|nr:olfactory receptor 502-like [Perognathus longimembris pacificus]